MPPKKELKIKLDLKQPQLNSFYTCHYQREDKAEQTQYEKEISKEKNRYELRKTISRKVAKNLVLAII